MFKGIWRTALIVGVAITALAGAEPALGFSKVIVTGTVGAYKVRDTQLFPGAGCTYRYSSANQAWQLKHISVGPPSMKAVPGIGIEKVAWQFTVQRRITGFGGPGPWQDRYTSSKFTATTDSTHNATFSSEGVKVIVPFQIGSDASAEYRAKVKLTWYKTNGTTVLGTVTGKIDWYYVDDIMSRQINSPCPDYDV